ncbi:unnamed protein product [Rotaria magnacalcarata]|uniref:Nephrocystin-3 n=2 Tax=Rotaria magnacalcarata TaxID=392030 RepID=A0A816A0X9_9BILA|nr:unnamed protein product [Rotaria magnacalcarata]
MGFTTSKFVNGSESIDSLPKNADSSLNKLANAKQNTLNGTNNTFAIVWLDTSVNDADIIHRNSIARFRRISVLIKTFINVDECLQYLTKMKETKILMILAGICAKEIWPRIKSMKHIHSVYIIVDGDDDDQNKEYSKQEYEKVKGIFDRVDPIYGFLKRDTRHIEQDVLGISIIPSDDYLKQDLRQLNSLFLYWFLVKQIILDLKYDDGAHKSLAEFCRSHYTENTKELKIIDEYENNHQDHSPVWWYTRQCFLYVMLNRAIQTQDIEVIIRMAPFIQDLHRNIEEIETSNETSSIVLYRSQITSKDDFEKMRTTEGHLLSFHNFMLTNSNYKTALDETRRARGNVNSVALLFRIEVDSSQNSNCFTSLKNASYLKDQESYFLFSMHSIFHITEIKQIENQVWQITLKLTKIDDKQLIYLKELIHGKTQNVNQWYRLAKLMAVLREFDHAKEIYHVLLNLLPTTESSKLCYIYNELGIICDETGDYRLALSFYQKALEIQRKTTHFSHHLLSIAYNNIGEIQRELGDYFKALSYHKKTLSIKQKILSPHDLSLATTYNNLGLANQSLGEFATALEFYEKSLNIKRKALSPTHIDFAVTYNNMGELHREMGKYAAALKYLEKGLQIRLKTCSPNDSSLAITYNNIGLIHREQGDYNQAISYFRKSLEIKEKTYTSNHPALAISYINIGEVHQLLGEFPEAISSYEKALEIQEKAYSINHPDLAITYNNLGIVHQLLGNYPSGLSFYQKALKIRQKSLPPNHPALATTYNNIGHVSQLMGDNNVALEYYQKTKNVQEKCLGPYHPSLAATFNNLGDIQRTLGNHKKALGLYEKSLEIKKKSLSPNHPTLSVAYNNIGVVHQAMQKHALALEYYKKALEIQQKNLPLDHPDVALSYYNIGTVHQSIKQYSIALDNYEKALKIQEKTLSPNHPDLAHIHNSTATAYFYLEKYQKALEHEQRAVDISTQSLSPDHPHLQTFKLHLQRIQSELEVK